MNIDKKIMVAKNNQGPFYKEENKISSKGDPGPRYKLANKGTRISSKNDPGPRYKLANSTKLRSVKHKKSETNKKITSKNDPGPRYKLNKSVSTLKKNRIFPFILLKNIYHCCFI